MAQTGSNKKVGNSLVALSSAAVLAVYSAGYQRTKAAADRFERQAASRRHPAPAPAAPDPVLAPTAPGAVPAGSSSVDVRGLSAPSGIVAADSRRTVPATGATPAAGALSVTPGDAPTPAQRSQSADEAPRPPVTAEAPAVPTAPAASEPQLASAAPAEVAPAVPLPRGRFKDGTHLGWGSCRHGDIQAQVVVDGGRIVSASIAQCNTRYSCDWLDRILPQVAARQSAFVDYVSGATESTDAFSEAVTDALSKAQ